MQPASLGLAALFIAVTCAATAIVVSTRQVNVYAGDLVGRDGNTVKTAQHFESSSLLRWVLGLHREGGREGGGGRSPKNNPKRRGRLVVQPVDLQRPLPPCRVTHPSPAGAGLRRAGACLHPHLPPARPFLPSFQQAAQRFSQTLLTMVVFSSIASSFRRYSLSAKALPSAPTAEGMRHSPRLLHDSNSSFAAAVEA